MQDKWYNNTVIYAIDVETYMDGNRDGTGDFPGLSSRLDYLSGLGINCIWLRPFFPSPRVDDGYDVSDYYTIDPRYGDPGDFADFITRANATGIRVIIDMVVNHTSDKHPWFEQARKNKKSKYRDYYIWSSKPDKKDRKNSLLSGGGIWTYDKIAGAYYLHHFLKEQPDLNLSNPEVRTEIKKIMGFWLKMGVSGFRIDAAHIWIKPSKKVKQHESEILSILNEMRDFVKHRNSEAVLLAEANVKIKSLNRYFADGSRADLLFNFIVNQHLFLSMAREDPTALSEAMKNLQNINGQWVNFLRHHDELNLEMLTEKERREIFGAFAPKKNMRIFGHGVRRRLPPMVSGDRKKLELFYAVMFSLPGIPLINYGEEIAMGDDLTKKGRLSVRTVMQWQNSAHAGFSTAPSVAHGHEAIDSGDYSYHNTNVADQQRTQSSFLNWMERLISTRKQCPQLSYGKWHLVGNNKAGVLSFCCEWQEDTILILHNFRNEAQKVKLKQAKKMNRLIELFSNREYQGAGTAESVLELDPYGYRWFKTDNY